MDNDLIQDTNLDLLQVNAVEVEYSGIAPINVDNQEHTISLDPSALSSKLDTSAFDEWTATHSAGEEYSAGNGIDITDHVISYTGDPGEATPWISGNKIITSADVMQPGEYVQVLSSFDLSGDKNHFITVKGQGYYFPTNQQLKERVGVEDYLPLSSFSSYTASIADNLQNNWNYTNSAYSQSLNNYYNKLDASAFSSVSGDFYTNDNPSGFITGVDLSDYYKKNETSSKEEIANALTAIDNTISGLTGEFQEKGDYLSASEKFLSANALDELSGNWESTYDTVRTNSATWEKVKDLHNVEISSTNSSIGVTATTAVDGTVKYDLSVDEVAVPDISGYNGISARYNEETNQYEVGFKENDYAYLFGHYGNNDTLTAGTILKLDSNNYYKISIDEDGYITLPQTTNKFTFCINEYIDDNTTQNHEYLLNKLVLSAKNSDSIVASQNYYPSEVGSSNVTLALTIDNSISPKEYCIVYKGSDVVANKLKIEASILEEVSSLDSSRGEVDDYTGREPIRVVQNSRVVELLYDEDVFTLKQDASLGTKKLSIESAGGEVVNKETFDKLLDSINSRIVETIPIGTINYHSYINAGQAISYIFRPMIEFEMNQQTTARIIAGNASTNQSQVMISVYELNEIDYTLKLIWWSELKTLTHSKGEQVLLANNAVGQTISIKPDGLYYVRMICLGQQIQQLLGLQNTVQDDLGDYDLVYVDSTTNTDPYTYIGHPAGDLGQTANSTLKPYVGFKNVGSNS